MRMIEPSQLSYSVANRLGTRMAEIKFYIEKLVSTSEGGKVPAPVLQNVVNDLEEVAGWIRAIRTVPSQLIPAKD